MLSNTGLQNTKTGFTESIVVYLHSNHVMNSCKTNEMKGNEGDNISAPVWKCWWGARRDSLELLQIKSKKGDLNITYMFT